MINTTYGELDESTLNRSVVLEDRPTEMVVLVRWQLPAGVNDRDAQGPEKFGELVRQDAFPLPKEAGPDVSTTLGMVPFSELERVVELDRRGAGARCRSRVAERRRARPS
jgi:hypothetical protein